MTDKKLTDNQLITVSGGGTADPSHKGNFVSVDNLVLNQDYYVMVQDSELPVTDGKYNFRGYQPYYDYENRQYPGVYVYSYTDARTYVLEKAFQSFYEWID